MSTARQMSSLSLPPWLWGVGCITAIFVSLWSRRANAEGAQKEKHIENCPVDEKMTSDSEDGDSVRSSAQRRVSKQFWKSLVSEVQQNAGDRLLDTIGAVLGPRGVSLDEFVTQFFRESSEARIMVLHDLLGHSRCLLQLIECVNELSSKFDVEGVCRHVVSATRELLAASGSMLLLVDDQHSKFVTRVVETEEQPASISHHVNLPISSGIAGYVAATGNSISLDQPREDERFSADVDAVQGVEAQSLLAVPLRDQQGRIFAVLAVQNKRTFNDGFTQEDFRFLRTLAAQAGLALHRNRLYGRALRNEHRMGSLLEMVRSVSSDLDLDAVVQNIVKASYDLLDTERVTLFLTDDDNEELVVYISKDAEGIRVPFGQGLVGHCAASGEVINVPDAYADARFNSHVDNKTQFRTKSVLCVPIHSTRSGKLVAVLQAVNKKDATGLIVPFTEEDESTLRAFASQAVLAIANSQLLKERTKTLEYTRTVLRNISDIVFALGADGKLRTSNRPIDELFGFPESTLRKLSFQSWLRAVPENDLLATDVEEVFKNPSLTVDRKEVKLYPYDSSKHILPCVDVPDTAPKTVSLEQVVGRTIRRPSIKPTPIDTGDDDRRTSACSFSEFEVHASPARSFKRLASMPGPGTCLPPSPDLRCMNGIQEEGSTPQSPKEDEDTYVIVHYRVSALHEDGAFCGVLVAMEDMSELNQMQQQVNYYQEKHKEMEALRKKVLKMSDSPVQAVIRIVGDVAEAITSDDTHTKLLTCIDLLQSVDLFRPAFVTEMEDKAVCDVWRTPTTKAVLHQYAKFRPKEKSIHEVSKMYRMILDSENRAFESWNYVPFGVSDAELIANVISMFRRFNLLEHFKIPVETLETFVLAVKDQYQDNPYHNFQHAFSVLHCVYMILTTTRALERFSINDVAALVIGALVHDVDHPGVTNAHLSAVESDLALLYNDLSILENHHCHVASTILRNPTSAILANASRKDQDEIRHTMIHAVLSTDMAKHFELVSRLRSHIDAGLKKAGRRANRQQKLDHLFPKKDTDCRQLLLNAILHAADLSAPLLPFDLSKQWSERVVEEFHHQAVLEQDKGIPVIPSVEAYTELPSPSRHADLQLPFLDLIVTPLWEALADVFPVLKERTAALRENRNHWASLASATPKAEKDVASEGSSRGNDRKQLRRASSRGGAAHPASPKVMRRRSGRQLRIPLPVSPTASEGGSSGHSSALANGSMVHEASGNISPGSGHGAGSGRHGGRRKKRTSNL